MDFCWLSSDRGNFAWLFSTITESYKPEANIWWYDECWYEIWWSYAQQYCIQKWRKIMLVNSFPQACPTEIFKIHNYATAILQWLFSSNFGIVLSVMGVHNLGTEIKGSHKRKLICKFSLVNITHKGFVSVHYQRPYSTSNISWQSHLLHPKINF